MSEATVFSRIPVRRNTRRAKRLKIIGEIIETLERLGGSAHYDIIIEHIAAERKLVGPQARQALRRQILEVFKDHCEADGKAGEQAMFRRVYGPDSRRWSLADAFHQRWRSGGVDLEQQLTL